MELKPLTVNSGEPFPYPSPETQKQERKTEKGDTVPIVLPKCLERGNDPIKGMKSRRKNHSESCI